MRGIKSIQSSWLPLLLLVFSLIGGPGVGIKAATLVLGVIVFGRRFFSRCIDQWFFLLLFFGTIYYLMSNVGPLGKTDVSTSTIFFPAAAYAAGKWLGFCSRTVRGLCWGYFIIGVALSFNAVVSVLYDVAQYGFLGGGRNIEIVGSGGQELSATVLAGSLVLLISSGGVVFSSDESLSLAERLSFLLLAFVGVFVALRLGSRTFIAIGAITLIIGLIVNIKKLGYVNSVLFAVLLVSCLWGGVNYVGGDLDLFSYFQDRIDDDEVGSATAGGRTEKWVNSLYLLQDYPWGWGLSLNGYSHNLWLDSARNSGWVGFFLISFVYFASLYSLLSVSKGSALGTYLTCIVVGFSLLFFVEPILDGFVIVFCGYCALWGGAAAHRSLE